MPLSGENLTAKQTAAARELARGATIDNAATAASVNEKTVDKWLKDEQFQQAVLGIRREIHQQAIGAIVDSLTVAVTALRDIAGDATAPASSRVSASKTLLDSAYRAIEASELEARLLALEIAFQEYKS